MARRGNGSDGDNNAKIKIVYFEAENVSGDLTGMIREFANAVRTAPVHAVPNVPRQIEGQKARIVSDNGHFEASLVIDDEVEMEDPPTPAAKRASSPRKPFKGKVLQDIAWDGGGTSLDAYITQKNPQDTTKKYLVIAAWFNRFGGRESVTVNLIYNAYRIMSWGNIVDWGHTLREGARSERGYYIGDKKGNYIISPVGLKLVDKMGTEKPESDE